MGYIYCFYQSINFQRGVLKSWEIIWEVWRISKESKNLTRKTSKLMGDKKDRIVFAETLQVSKGKPDY